MIMKRSVITISENGRVDIPSEDVWMSEMELMELFGVVAPTLRSAIKAIYRNSGICPTTTRCCDVATPISWATFYNIEVIIALSFRLDTYEAERIRRKVLECVYQRKENCVRLFISLAELRTNHTKSLN